MHRAPQEPHRNQNAPPYRRKALRFTGSRSPRYTRPLGLGIDYRLSPNVFLNFWDFCDFSVVRFYIPISVVLFLKMSAAAARKQQEANKSTAIRQ